MQPDSSTSRNLHDDHHPEAIRQRLNEPRRHSHLGDAVLGGIDGCVTTFAVVAGSIGGGLPDFVIIVLGFANLLADGFSMAASNYLSVKSGQEEVEKARREEHDHIARVPHGEREEVRQIFAKKGFEGELLENVVDVITRDDSLWAHTMLTEEHGLQVVGRHPVRAGLATFAAFVLVGLMPLLPFVLPVPGDQKFALSIAITAFAFLAVGMTKGLVVRMSAIRAGLETLLVGGTAAVLAYIAGRLLRQMYGNG